MSGWWSCLTDPKVGHLTTDAAGEVDVLRKVNGECLRTGRRHHIGWLSRALVVKESRWLIRELA